MVAVVAQVVVVDAVGFLLVLRATIFMVVVAKEVPVP
jgi:hypothetical protein